MGHKAKTKVIILEREFLRMREGLEILRWRKERPGRKE